MLKRIISTLLAALMLTGAAVSISGCGESKKSESSESESSGEESATEESTTEEGEKPSPMSDSTAAVANGSILQVFCWDFDTIKQSMPDIKAAGFTAIQTSPVNECLVGEDGGMELYGDGKWYYHYQPTDFKIGNYQLGNREQFKEMCDVAHQNGIKVLVDVIANHTTPRTDKVSQDLINAGGGSLETLYHEHNKDDIMNYDNRLQCTTAKMGGLPDINTERPSFQEYFFKFINDCIDCGADGFRYDTAKHIGLPDDPKEDDGYENNFWEKVKTETKDYDQKFIYGEVLQGGNDRVEDYIKEIGRTTASAYGSKIRSSLSNNSLNKSVIEKYWLGSVDPTVVTWVESHDNYINDKTFTELNNDQIILGWSIIASRKDGTPLFFSRPYNSKQGDEWGMNRIGPQGDDMYKDARVTAVNHFRTAVIGEDESIVNPGDDTSAVIIERGKKGAVIVNTKGELKTGFDIGLEDGEYTDRVDGKTVYTVKGGKLTSDKTVPENTVVVLCNDGFKQEAPMANAGVAKDTVFKTDGKTLSAVLTLENAKKGTYTIDGKATEFKNGDKITVNKPAQGNVVKVELRAKNSEGTETYERVEFTFEDRYQIKKGTKIYFQPPSNWDASKISVYIYNIADEDENKYWPGEAMTKESDGKFSYTFTRDWDTPLMIFNDGTYQSPADKGVVVEPNKIYVV